MKHHDIVEIVATQVHETQMAYLINDGATEAWVPKSQVERSPTAKPGVYEYSMPERLAVQKGFF